MSYISRRAARKRSTLSAEFVYLLVVLAAGIATAWWAGHRIGMDLSAISTFAAILGVNETVSTPHQVGYSQASASVADSSSPQAPYCQPGQVASFDNGFATLHQIVGDAMGTPLECEHASSAGGDTVQQTSTGLAAYDAQTNTVSFTDGWHHWALTPQGYATWEGTEAQPPADTEPS